MHRVFKYWGLTKGETRDTPPLSTPKLTSLSILASCCVSFVESASSEPWAFVIFLLLFLHPRAAAVLPCCKKSIGYLNVVHRADFTRYLLLCVERKEAKEWLAVADFKHYWKLRWWRWYPTLIAFHQTRVIWRDSKTTEMRWSGGRGREGKDNEERGSIGREDLGGGMERHC